MAHIKESRATCPISKTAELLSDTWTMLIMSSLNQGPKRFCELEQWLEGISTRTLTLKLKKLTDLELITKTDEGFYQATEKGTGLKMIEKAMTQYGEKYLSK